MNTGALEIVETEIAAIAADMATRRWVKDALSTALRRDPVDAAADADRVAGLLNRRCDALLEDSDQMEMFGAMPPSREQTGEQGYGNGSGR